MYQIVHWLTMINSTLCNRIFFALSPGYSGKSRTFFINLKKEDVEWLSLHRVHSKISSFFQSEFLLPLCNTELDKLTFSPNLFPPHKLQNIKVPQFIFWGSDNKFPYTFLWETNSIFFPRTISVSCLFLLRQ